MSRIEVATEHGPIWFWGEDRGLPIVLVLTGFRATSDTWEPRTSRPRGFDFLRTHLPANLCPPIDEVSVDAYAEALDEALTSRFSRRPVVAVGMSAGALVALALKHRDIRRLVLLEPPLRTHDLWPLRRALDPTEGLSEVELHQLDSLFGIGPRGTEGRDYTTLLDSLSVPARVLLGDEPLIPPRDLARLPSFVDAPSRAALRSHPLVRSTVVKGGGHAIQMEALQACVEIVLEEARAAFDNPELDFTRAS